MRVSPAICNRVVDAVRGVLNQFVSDIYIYTDHCKGGQSGKYVILKQTFNFFTRESACFTTIHAVNIHSKTKIIFLYFLTEHKAYHVSSSIYKMWCYQHC